MINWLFFYRVQYMVLSAELSSIKVSLSTALLIYILYHVIMLIVFSSLESNIMFWNNFVLHWLNYTFVVATGNQDDGTLSSGRSVAFV